MKNFKIALVAGGSIFAMMFGSSNIVMPMMMIKAFPDSWFGAYLGFASAAVLMPLIGLFAMISIDGDENRFYGPISRWRYGKAVHFLIVAVIMIFCCPLGSIPRSVSVAVGALSSVLPNVSSHTIYIVSYIVLAAVMLRESALIDILSKYLSPIKIIALVLFVALGIDYGASYTGGGVHMSEYISGCKTGYITADLIAAVMFSSMIIKLIKEQSDDPLKTSIIAFSLTGLLLGIVYLGFFMLYSTNYDAVSHIADSTQALSAIAEHSLGHLANLFVSVLIAVTCFTTVIALMTVWIKYLERVFGVRKYHLALIGTYVVSYLVSTMMNFEQILYFMAPAIGVIYPIIIVLAVIHIVVMLKRNDNEQCRAKKAK